MSCGVLKELCGQSFVGSRGQVVSDDLRVLADLCHEGLVGIPVVLIEGVLTFFTQKQKA